jgi:uncharacterized protein (TIGR02757 family)
VAKVRRAIYSRLEQIERLRQPFDLLYDEYRQGFVHTDPIQFPRRFTNRLDQELIAFLSAMFAFGNVAAISRSLERILSVLGSRPALEIVNWPTECPPALQSFRHRWIGSDDLQVLLRSMKSIYAEGSLEALFLEGYDTEAHDVSGAVTSFSQKLRKYVEAESGGELSRGLKFLISLPSPGGVLKRMNLFLRWVVRRIPPDLGLWVNVDPSKLLLPIDTHMSRFVRYTGLTRLRGRVGWKMVLEATESLRYLSARDPIRYDFALTRLGILDRCRHHPDPVACPECPLRKACRLNKNRY